MDSWIIVYILLLSILLIVGHKTPQLQLLGTGSADPQTIWTSFCGLTGESSTEGSSECKIKVAQLITYLVFAALSAFYFGRRPYVFVRDKTQMICIYMRLLAMGGLALIPPVKLYILLINTTSNSNIDITPVDLLRACYQTIAMIVHCVFLLSLRSHGTLSGRGPLPVIIVWLLIFVILIPLAYSDSSKSDRIGDSLAITFNVLYGLCLVVPAGRSTLIGSSRNVTEAGDEREPLLGNEYVRFQQHPDERALGPASRGSLISKLYFSWVSPLIRMASEKPIQSVNDLFALPDSMSFSRIAEKFQQNIDKSRTLFQALHNSFGREFYLIGLLRLIADTSGFAGPLLLGGLLHSKYDDEGIGQQSTGLFYAGGLFLAAMLASYCSVHFNWRISIVTIKMRIAMVSAIYRKSLEARGLRNARPEVLNLMSTDTDRIVNSCISFHSFWSIPLQLFVSLYLLYTQVGAAFTAGLLFAIFLIPVNKYIAGRIGKLSEDLMRCKDERVLTTSEVLHGARQIKLNAWERMFVEKIAELRNKEIVFLGKRKYLDALCVYFWATTPLLMCLFTFGVAALTNQSLDASTIYTSVALLNMLIGPLNSFPWVLNGLVEAWVSLKRVQELIDLPNLDLADFYHPVQNRKPAVSARQTKPIVLHVKSASFLFHNTSTGRGSESVGEEEEDQINRMNPEVTQFVLEDISFEVKRGELVCITGNVGSGKSTILSAIIGDMNCVRGSVLLQDVTTGFGYVSQNAWLQRGTIRENILWGQVYEREFYHRVVFACGLQEDLQRLGGDGVFVGDKGLTLSGGQRMRIALARAVYQKKPIYLLDDILSCLDAHVANHVIQYCLFGLLATTTRLVVTDQRSVQRAASQIFHFESGKMTIKDPTETGEEGEEEEHTGASTCDWNQFGVPVSPVIGPKEEQDEQFEERMETGSLKKSTLLAYWRAVRGQLGGAVLVSVFLMQMSRNYSDILLAQWVAASTDNSTGIEESHGGRLMAMYSSVVILNSLLTLVRSFLFAYAGIKAAVFIHDKLLNAVVRAKFSFFDVTPVGRMLNRFSSDTYTVDDNLPFVLNILLAQLFGLLGAVTTTLFALPWVTILVVPMFPIYLNLQHRYRMASRNIKRLASTALSPLYSHFTETLDGLTTIRAMRASSRFYRNFLVKLENSARTQLTTSAAQCWLAIRLQMLGSFLIGGCSVVAALTGAHVTSAGYVGLAISYALSITNLLSGVLSALAETELEMVAVERVNEYSELPPEEDEDDLGTQDPPYGWPCQGAIRFDNVSLAYEELNKGERSLSLKRVSFETDACEKLGIVGRTGAGKTSILSALFRTHNIIGGEISIDSVAIRNLPLPQLRDRIAYVAQDPFLFRDTIRKNLDPLNKYYESDIWSGIAKCLTTPLVLSLGGLNSRIEPQELSTGQKQLLCLTRAFLKKAKIICIDEGTAHLDRDSDAAIQNVLGHMFRNCTVIQIAHRLNNVMALDRVLVMRDGQVMECGSPQMLANDPKSVFSQMLDEQKGVS